jgi:hypothetical protein
MANLNKIRVEAGELRKRFNERIQPKLDAKVYHLSKWTEHAPSKSSNQVAGTKSIMYAVIDQRGNRVALVHVFEKPDGTYGGSGKLDPKEIRNGNTIYFI